MATPATWCADKLSKLQIEDMRIPTLHEIKEHLEEISDTESTSTAKLLELPLVFDCLNNSNEEQVNLACDVLSLCMERLDISETTRRYSIPLERALTHPTPGVNLMALQQIARILQCEDADLKMQLVDELSSGTMFTTIIQCISSTNLEVASKASFITIDFAKINIDPLVSPPALPIVMKLMTKNEIVRLRFYEIFIELCATSTEIHNNIILTGVLAPMINEIASNDILLRLNIIQLLYKLVECPHGYDYLNSEGFFGKLMHQVFEEEDTMFLQLCEPGIIQLFGHMAHCKPAEVFNDYPHMVEKIFLNLNGIDYTIMKASLEAIAYIGKDDKTILDTFVGENMLKAVNTMAKRLPDLPTPEKVNILNWMQELLHDKMMLKKNSVVSQKWFVAFGQNPMDLVTQYVQNPFEELHNAGLGVVLSLTQHRWGQVLIKDTPGLVEQLTNVSVDSSTTKSLKLQIATSICTNQKDVFDLPTITRFMNTARIPPSLLATTFVTTE